MIVILEQILIKMTTAVVPLAKAITINKEKQKENYASAVVALEIILDHLKIGKLLYSKKIGDLAFAVGKTLVMPIGKKINHVVIVVDIALRLQLMKKEYPITVVLSPLP